MCLVVLLALDCSLYGLFKRFVDRDIRTISMENPPVAAIFPRGDAASMGDPDAAPMTGLEEDFFDFNTIALQDTVSSPNLYGIPMEIKKAKYENLTTASETIQAPIEVGNTDTETPPEEILETTTSLSENTISENGVTLASMLRTPIHAFPEGKTVPTKDVAPDYILAGEEPPEDGTKKPGVTEYVAVPLFTPRSPFYDYTGVKPLTTTYDYDLVTGNDYFDDALFIGDSRVEGLYLYGGLENATFAYKRGCSVSYIPTGALNVTASTTSTLANILSSKKFGKVYIMVGVNELGGGSPAYYGSHYKALVDMILAYQPDTIVFMFGTMYVTKAYSDSSNTINNDNIDSRSCRVAAIADGIHTFYLDMNPSVADETGYVNPNFSWDGIHLKPEYYENWVQFMREHAILP